MAGVSRSARPAQASRSMFWPRLAGPRPDVEDRPLEGGQVLPAVLAGDGGLGDGVTQRRVGRPPGGRAGRVVSVGGVVGAPLENGEPVLAGRERSFGPLQPAVEPRRGERPAGGHDPGLGAGPGQLRREHGQLDAAAGVVVVSPGFVDHGQVHVGAVQRRFDRGETRGRGGPGGQLETLPAGPQRHFEMAGQSARAQDRQPLPAEGAAGVPAGLGRVPRLTAGLAEDPPGELGQGDGRLAGPARHVQHHHRVDHLAGGGIELAGHVVDRRLPRLHRPAEQRPPNGVDRRAVGWGAARRGGQAGRDP